LRRGRDATVLLEGVEEALDEIALAIEGEVGLARLTAIGLWWNDGRDATFIERLDERVAVVAFVGQQRRGLDPLVEFVEQGHGLIDIGGLARRQRQRDGQAERIDDGMDLGRQTTARAADGLVLAVFFWAPALC
jgi:hypothetical protein